jgi:hypothetical protein
VPPSLLAGILGDPQFFVLESRDDDRETRVFDPVLFSMPGNGAACSNNVLHNDAADLTFKFLP